VKEENAKWFLNIQWQMTGVDVHADSDIGKHLSALARTLTTLTGEEEDDQQVKQSGSNFSCFKLQSILIATKDVK
jgi:hypothetical protein